jgi:hypothetical protein
MRISAMCMVTATLATVASGGNAAPADPTDTYLAGRTGVPTDEDVSRIPVGERPHHAFEPIGLNAGPIFFYPELSGGFRYESNVYATPTDRKSDTAFILSPRLTIISDMRPFSYKAHVGTDIYRFQKLTGEDRTDAHAALNTQVEIAHDLVVKTFLEAAKRHEERTDAASPANTAAPVPYTDLSAQASITKQFNRFGVEFGTSARKLTYGTVQTFSGEALDLDWRSGAIVTGWIKPSYQISPNYQVFVRSRINDRDYKGTGDLNHDSSGYDIRGGVSFAASTLFLGSVEAGYLSQKFSNPLIPHIEGPSFAADAKWLVTPLTTITFSADRMISETASVGHEARLDTLLGIGIDHELLRNLVLFSGVTHIDQNFRGTPRVDEVVKLSAGFDYFASPIARFGVRYDFINRNSNLPMFGFNDHVVTVNATAQY